MLGFGADSEVVLGSILDEPHLGVLWPPPCKDFVATCPSIELSARGSTGPSVADRREKEEITVQEHGLSEFANPKDIQVRFKLETEKNAVWFFGEEMGDLILG